jgi:putative SOS response-associated peptidase YedK
MCGRFVLMTPGRDLAERFGLEEEPVLEPRYNIAPTQMVAIIRLEKETGRRRLDFVRWGLIPFWSKDPSIGNKLINARAETAAEKPAFSSAFKSRRCLVPADGYYEWKKRKEGQKQPYLARNADGTPFAFAGLWEKWQAPEDQIIESCTILTTDANDLTRPIHDRMPVVYGNIKGDHFEVLMAM